MPELASDVAILSDSGKELILQFPFAAARHFPQVLGGLEQQMSELRVESYGVSITTLEEVFLKVASGETIERPAMAGAGMDGHDGEAEYIELQEVASPSSSRRARDVRLLGTGAGPGVKAQGSHLRVPGAEGCDYGQPASGARLAAMRVRALLRKRWRYGMRDRRGLLCQLLLPSGTLLVLLLIMSSRLFYSMPALELDALGYNKYCEGGPQNLVDFSHLASVDAREAEAVLGPGRPFWNGDLRRFDPAPESSIEGTEERTLTSTIPGLFSHVVRPAIQKALAEQRARAGRRLEAAGGDAPAPGEADAAAQGEVEARLLHLAMDLWAAASLAHHPTEAAVAEVAPAAAPRGAAARRLQQTLSRLPFRLPGVPRESLNLTSLDLSSPWFASMPNSCANVSTAERVAWMKADADHDGKLSKQEALWVIRHLVQTLGAGRRHGAREAAAEAKLDRVLEKALFFSLDQNHDGTISMPEFCAFGETVRRQVGRVVSLGTRFSQQLLESKSACTRYGAYYVLHPAASGLKWDAGSDAVIFVNTSSSHAAPTFQAALTNARLSRLGLGKRVAVKTHPFPQTRLEQHSLEKVAVFILSIYITFCLSFIPAGIAHFVVMEKQTGSRNLQILSGASYLSYWTANLIYDIALYSVPALCVPAALYQFGFNMILVGDCGWALCAVLTAFGPAVAGFSYIVSFLFKDHARASNAILTFCLVGASVLSSIWFILAIVNYNPVAEYPSACEHPTKESPIGTCHSYRARAADKFLGPIFRLVPTVCVYQALFSIALVANLRAVIPQGSLEAMSALSGTSAPKLSLDPFAYEWAGEALLYLCAEAVVFFAAAVVLDICLHSPRLAHFFDAATWARWLASWRTLRGRMDAARSSPLIDGGALMGSAAGDDSVEAERERLALVSPEDLALHVWRLEKVYRNWLALRAAPKHAVRGLSFAVHPGEVFGLLGHNGAGKTSALKCLVGELNCTAGTVHVGGFDMERRTSKARRRAGYCPQFDALLELLTVQDHLELFAALKGFPPEVAAQAREDFKLGEMAGRRAEQLSGGNKRKLSAAIALMGGPSLAVLDEPSCGLDPAARRALWVAVHSAVAGTTALPGVGKSTVGASAVLLTTHSMEEAEALSTRLGIMAEGQLLMVGTSQQIKQRHGGAHELRLTLKAESEHALATTLHHLGGAAMQPGTALGLQSLGPLLEADPPKKRAYVRQRCVIRAQIESIGHVEAAVLAEWWLQMGRGEAIEGFLRGLLGDGVELAENFGSSWRFRLPHAGVGLPELFRHLEERGKELGIAEYTLTQATLEQIFNSIAQEVDQDRQGGTIAVA